LPLLILDLGGMMKDSDRLKDLGKKLDKTLEERRGASGSDTQEGSAAGLAMRAVSELIVGLLVCMGLGWAADKYLGTAPWIMLALMPIGLAAGVANVMRLSNSKQAEELLGGKGPVPPTAIDDEDED
jgi:ATP synthase protein I